MHKVREAQVSLKSSKEWLRYKKHMHIEKVNHKPQAHARYVCDENNEENKEKNDCL